MRPLLPSAYRRPAGEPPARKSMASTVSLACKPVMVGLDSTLRVERLKLTTRLALVTAMVSPAAPLPGLAFWLLLLRLLPPHPASVPASRVDIVQRATLQMRILPLHCVRRTCRLFG